MRTDCLAQPRSPGVRSWLWMWGRVGVGSSLLLYLTRRWAPLGWRTWSYGEGLAGWGGLAGWELQPAGSRPEGGSLWQGLIPGCWRLGAAGLGPGQAQVRTGQMSMGGAVPFSHDPPHPTPRGSVFHLQAFHSLQGSAHSGCPCAPMLVTPGSPTAGGPTLRLSHGAVMYTPAPRGGHGPQSWFGPVC